MDLENKTFQRNKKLISMKSIPNEIEELIVDDIKSILSQDNDNLADQILLEGI